MPVTFDPSGGTAFKNWHHCVSETTWSQKHNGASGGLRNTSEPHCQLTVSCCINLQMQVKLLHGKQKSYMYINNTKEHCRLLWAQAHLRWTDTKWKSAQWFSAIMDVIRSGQRGKRPSGFFKSRQLLVWELR